MAESKSSRRSSTREAKAAAPKEEAVEAKKAPAPEPEPAPEVKLIGVSPDMVRIPAKP